LWAGFKPLDADELLSLGSEVKSYGTPALRVVIIIQPSAGQAVLLSFLCRQQAWIKYSILVLEELPKVEGCGGELIAGLTHATDDELVVWPLGLAGNL